MPEKGHAIRRESPVRVACPFFVPVFMLNHLYIENKWTDQIISINTIVCMTRIQ